MVNPAEATDLATWAKANRDMVPHTPTLTRYAKEAKTIIEFGVRGGVSTWAFLDGLPDDGQLWSVDIDHCVVPDRVRGDPRWMFIVGDDREKGILGLLPKRADIVFIDTSHEYDHTVQELDYALSLQPKRILCHDADWDGVARAVSEFCAATDWDIASYDHAGDAGGDFSLVTLEPA